MDTATETYNPQPLNEALSKNFEQLARIRTIERRNRTRLDRVKNADQHIAYLIQARGTLIKECLDLEISSEDIAELLLQNTENIPINRRKLINGINRCARAENENPRKRTIQQPKKPDDDPAQPGQDAKAAALPDSPGTPDTAKTTLPDAAAATKPPAKPEKPSAPAAKQDSPDREQRMRRKGPIWATNYKDDSNYGHLVVRNEDESDADFFWRMWHTAPPWSDEMPRRADQLSETQWIEKCWGLKSPEERAAHDASLPSTAQ